MRAVDQHRHAGRTTRRDDRVQRQHQRAAGGDVINHRDARTPGQCRGNGGNDRRGVGAGKRNHRLGHPRAGALGHEPHRVAHRAVAVAEHQHLVVRRQTQRPQHGVAAGGGVVEEADVVAVRAEEHAEPRGGRHQSRLQPLMHEARGLRLELASPILLRRQHDARGCAEGTVIDGQPAPVQRPLVPHRAAKQRRRRVGPAHADGSRGTAAFTESCICTKLRGCSRKYTLACR